eukprot:8992541-Alexandrium_andersonii.AAC.1
MGIARVPKWRDDRGAAPQAHRPPPPPADLYFRLRNLSTVQNLRRPITIIMVVMVAWQCRNHK